MKSTPKILEGDSLGPLTFTHSTLKEKNIFSRLLDSLHPFIKAVSNGLAVFFPSKALLAAFLKHIRQEKSKQFTDLVGSLFEYQRHLPFISYLDHS